jgi:octaprenyl-diphosphate synthase
MRLEKSQARGNKAGLAGRCGGPVPELKSILAPVSPEIAKVNKRLSEAMPSDKKLVKLSAAVGHVLGKQGKCLRPALVLLSCGLCGEEPSQAVEYASVMELIHIGSLVLDDLLDGSELRRGRKTINSRWGEQTALLAGTHLLLEVAGRIALDIEPARKLLIGTLETMFRGEALQFQSQGDFKLGEETYMEIIRGKSASLMSACCGMGAVAAGDGKREKLLGEFGLEMGIAFQIRDDVLDLVANGGKLGKELGSDLRDARMTLPLIHCAKVSSAGERRFLKSVFGSNNGRKIDVKRVEELVRSSESINYSMEIARGFARKALSRLESFEESEYRDALAALCRFAVERDY